LHENLLSGNGCNYKRDRRLFTEPKSHLIILDFQILILQIASLNQDWGFNLLEDKQMDRIADESSTFLNKETLDMRVNYIC